MTPYYADAWLTLYGGDCRAVLPTLPAESVHCVVTSPPYWGLRDYGTATWVGGDEGCDHVVYGGGPPESSSLDGAKQRGRSDVSRSPCRKCGAVRQDNQLGLEPTPEEYVANLVAVFREVRRVLRSDGTLWLNLGDSYAGGGTIGRNDTTPEALARRSERYGTGTGAGSAVGSQGSRAPVAGLKPKDLVGIPWRVAFALQADGWYLRSDIIWAKPNPMPESVTDRPTKSHEYLFLLAKSARYYFDADAVREPHVREWDESNGGSWAHGKGDAARVAERGKAGTHSGPYPLPDPAGRNIRSVWTVATAPYPGAHFAVFPPKLVEPCVKAGCPENGVVLDPFAGSGTVGMVAQRLSRRAVLIDLNPAYLVQCLERNQNLPLGLSA